jgi:hypothetical protein
LSVRLDKALETKEELTTLRDLLPASTPHSNTRPRNRQIEAYGSPYRGMSHKGHDGHLSVSPDKWLPGVLGQELSNALTSTDIFSTSALGRTMSKLFDDPYLSKHLPRTGGVFLWEQTAALPLSALLGLRQPDQDRVKAKLREITIAAPVFLAGAIGLLMYLRNKGLPVHIDYCFYRSSDILSEAWRDKCTPLPDGFACSVASFPEMLRTAKRFDYEPLMLLPGVSSRVVTRAAHSRQTDRDTCREILVIGDQPTSGSIYAQRLVRNRRAGDPQMHIKSVSARCFEDSAPPCDEGLGLVQGFPTYHYHHRVNGACLVDRPAGGENSLETILFIRRSMIADGRAALLNLLIRDVWLEVQESSAALSRLVALVSNDALYLKSLKRFGGFHRSATTFVRS